MSNKSKVYLIINFRNSSKTLKKCFESLIKQNYKNIFFVLFNHSSSDNSPNILRSLIKNYNLKNYKFLKAPSNKSLVQCRNLAVQFVLSKAEENDFLAFCDSDDWWHPNWLNHLIKKNTPSTDIIFCQGYMHLPNKIIKFLSHYDYPRLLYWHPIGLGSMIIKLKFIRKFSKPKLFDEICEIVYDTEFLVKIYSQVKVKKTFGRHYNYNRKNVSLSSNVIQVIKEWEYIRKKHKIKNFFKYHIRSIWYIGKEINRFLNIKF